jgi:hypothetical protein
MVDHTAASLPDQVREACAWVAGRARKVAIDEAALEAYANTLTSGDSRDRSSSEPGAQLDPATHVVEGDRELRAAFVICLDAINFGSGWWPTIRKRPGHSGYFTIAAGLADRFRTSGPWRAEALAQLSAADVADVVGQDPEHPLMTHFAVSLRDVGEHVRADHGGRFAAVVEAGAGSAVGVAEVLARWVAFADVSTYDNKPVPFFKRAQIAAADLNRTGVADLRDTKRLTAFADNLVPHVLRVDGVLRLDPQLEQAIDAGQLLVHDSPEEIELRACGVHAVELLSAAASRAPSTVPEPARRSAADHRLSPAEIDSILWNRGGRPRYKAIPRPRCRNTAY